MPLTPETPERIVYSYGYGRQTPDQFTWRLRKAGITAVIDVRRLHTGGRIWQYDYRQMEETMRGFYYTHAWCFGRKKEETLPEYAKRFKDEIAPSWIPGEARMILRRNQLQVCYICSCGKPLEANGEPRCHRVFVVDAIVAALKVKTEQEWEVKHL